MRWTPPGRTKCPVLLVRLDTAWKKGQQVNERKDAIREPARDVIGDRVLEALDRATSRAWRAIKVAQPDQFFAKLSQGGPWDLVILLYSGMNVNAICLYSKPTVWWPEWHLRPDWLERPDQLGVIAWLRAPGHLIQDILNRTNSHGRTGYIAILSGPDQQALDAGIVMFLLGSGY